MGNQNWDHLGEEIRRIVQDAVESENYEKLSRTVGDTVEKTVRAMKQGGRAFGEEVGSKYRDYKTYQKAWKEESVPVKVEVPSKVGPIIGAVIGFVGAMNFLPAALAFLLAAFFSLGDLLVTLGILFGTLVVGGIGAAFLSLGISSVKKINRIGRLKKYIKAIGKKAYCNVSVLGGAVGKPDDVVVKDLEYMIRQRWFGQGHLDRHKTSLMLTDQMYRQYLQLEAQRKTEADYTAKPAKKPKAEETVKAEEKPAKEVSEEKTSPVAQIIAKGEEYLAKIRACNDAIPGEEISAKIFRIETLVAKIFDRVEQNPKSVSDIRKLMEYYLPTTVKLLEAYAQMDAQPAGGENIRTAKKEIEATLDTLNVAFEKLLDSLFQETAWDVSSDISVLNTMLAQEGLKEDEITRKQGE
jgi:hypothetical protein